MPSWACESAKSRKVATAAECAQPRTVDCSVVCLDCKANNLILADGLGVEVGPGYGSASLPSQAPVECDPVHTAAPMLTSCAPMPLMPLMAASALEGAFALMNARREHLLPCAM